MNSNSTERRLEMPELDMTNLNKTINTSQRTVKERRLGVSKSDQSTKSKKSARVQATSINSGSGNFQKMVEEFTRIPSLGESPMSGGDSYDWEKMKLLNELTQGRELTKQLEHELHLAVSSSSSSSHDQTQIMLIPRILASYDKALSMINPNPPAGGCPRQLSELPPSLSGSPMSRGDSDRDPNDGSTPRERKAMERWTKCIRAAPDSELEGPPDDGFSWRKYGQKN